MYSRKNFIIPNGPFRGMKYDINEEHGSAWLPKLFGTYESELHKIIEHIDGQRIDLYHSVIDVGTADGYYMVGFFKLADQKNRHIDFFGFEADETRKKHCIKLAKANGFNDFNLFGVCTVEKLLEITKKYNRGLIFCDCEGCEYHLFNRKTIASISNYDLLIEIHEVNREGTAFNHFIQLLSSEYNLTIIGNNGIVEVPENINLTIPKFILNELLSEGRVESVGWIYAESRMF